MEITPEQIHQRNHLSQNFIVQDPDGQVRLNAHQWVQVTDVVITTAPGPFAPNAGLANFLGRFRIQSAPFDLWEFTPEFQAALAHSVKLSIDKIIAEKGWVPVTHPAPTTILPAPKLNTMADCAP